jgi:hypothetical protein
MLFDLDHLNVITHFKLCDATQGWSSKLSMGIFFCFLSHLAGCWSSSEHFVFCWVFLCSTLVIILSWVPQGFVMFVLFFFSFS